MASVNEILARLNLNRRDLSNISLVQLRTIFQDLTVKEISTLCAVSRRFNTLCKDESFWRRKVSDDYGIHKKYGNTWRETAINMGKVDMINLNGVWINGRTYMEILNDSLQNGADVITDLQLEYLSSYVADSIDTGDPDDIPEQDLLFDKHEEKSIQGLANRSLGRYFTENELNEILHIKSEEMYVIYAAVLAYNSETPYLPGTMLRSDSIVPGLQSYDFLFNMIDPILYVMQFSSFGNNIFYVKFSRYH